MLFKNLFTPLKIGNMEIKNRLIVPPMVVNNCTNNGEATEAFIAYHEAKAKGGWGLIITEDFAVDPIGRAFPCIPGLWDDSQIKGHAELAKRVHAHGAKIISQIYHAGRQTKKSTIGTDPVAPTALNCPVFLDMPHELTLEEVEEIIVKFGNTALRAKKAGLDGVEIHGAHGYLVSAFMSHYSNKRFDKYGGSLYNRMQFPLNIVSDIRRKCGDDFVVQFRISGDEFVPGGRTIEDTKTILMMLEEAGINSFDISAGTHLSGYAETPSYTIRHGWISDFTAEIKKVIKVPVFTVGRINDPFIAEQILACGKADGILMGRASLADPELPNKVKEGRFQDIIHCTGCMQGCIGRIEELLSARCVVNPRTGRESEFEIKPAKVKKKIFIAGGGPAGMEAAIVAAQRGHDVTLFEKDKRLGGRYYLASIPPWKGEISAFLAWQVHTMDQVGVKVNKNTELTEDFIRMQKPDAVIIATGSCPVKPDIPGIDLDFVVDVSAVLEGKDVGEKVMVIGGGMIGSEVTNHLAHSGKKPTIVEILPEIAKDEPGTVKPFLLAALKEKEVPIFVNSTIKEIHADGTVEILQDGRILTLGKFDNIVIAVGMQSVNVLEEKLKGIVKEVKVVGDARSVRKVLEAVEEGYEVALNI